MPSNDPIPHFSPEAETVYGNARMALVALANATDGAVARAEAEDVVFRRVPGAGPRIARAALAALEREGVVEAKTDAARFMDGGETA